LSTVPQQKKVEKTAVLVTVVTGRFSQDDFFSEDVDSIQANVNERVLKITVLVDDEIALVQTYNSFAWKKIISRRVPSRAVV